MAVVISLNRFMAPADDTVTAQHKSQVTSHKSRMASNGIASTPSHPSTVQAGQNMGVGGGGGLQCRRGILVILWMSLRVGIAPCVSKIDTLTWRGLEFREVASKGPLDANNRRPMMVTRRD